MGLTSCLAILGFRDWEQEQRRLLSYESHAVTLTEYHRLGRIHRGLRVNLHPTLFSDDEELKENFERILNKCSMDIMPLTIERLQGAIEALNPKIKGIEQQLRDSMNGEEFTTLKNNRSTLI